MGRYEDILKRNEQLIDNVYEMNEEITGLASENEVLTKENEELVADNEILNEENEEMKESIANLHRNTARRYGNKRRQVCADPHCTVHQQAHNYEQQIQQCSPQPQPPQPQQPQQQDTHRTVSLYLSEKTKKNMLFGFLIFLILLLGLGIEPGVALTYDSILDCFLELIFNLYKLCILGCIGFCLRKLWKK